MNRTLKLIFSVVLLISLWCVTVTAFHVSAAKNLYTVMGKDARGMDFQVSLVEGAYAYHYDSLTIDQIREQNPDGDLRFIAVGCIRVGDIRLSTLINMDHPESTLDGQLNSVALYGEKDHIRIFVKLYEYPEDGKRTLFSDLLDTDTTMIAIDKLQSIIDEHGITEETCDLIKAELEKEYTPAWVLPTAICGGAVVFATAVAVLATALSRKKRKAAAAAAADTPAEEENA
jgi:hypothetical protein